MKNCIQNIRISTISPDKQTHTTEWSHMTTCVHQLCTMSHFQVLPPSHHIPSPSHHLPTNLPYLVHTHRDDTNNYDTGHISHTNDDNAGHAGFFCFFLLLIFVLQDDDHRRCCSIFYMYLPWTITTSISMTSAPTNDNNTGTFSFFFLLFFWNTNYFLNIVTT